MPGPHITLKYKQINQKHFFKFGPIFSPKFGEEQKKTLNPPLVGPGYNRLYFPLERLFPFEILPGLPIRNKISKSYDMFLMLNKYFAAELLKNKVKV